MYEESFSRSLVHKLSALVPDKLYLSLKYYKNFGRFPNWNNPKTFTEKLQWLKLHNRKAEYTTMVDKYEVKKYVADIIGERYIIPTLGVWDRAEDIDFDSLPDQFVLKATHDSGRVVICKDKAKLDKKKAIEDMKLSLQRDFYAVTREWPYKNVKRRIIAEQYMVDKSQPDGIADYKFFCFGGVPEFFKIDVSRFTDHHANYYDLHGNLLPFGEIGMEPKPDAVINMPFGLKEMVRLASLLSKGHPFLRVDFYEINGNMYFGELTFYPASGTGRFTDDAWDERIGSMLKLNVQ